MSESTKQYTNGEVTIHWNASACSHSGKCVVGLPDVFQPNARPWINMGAATSEELIDQVKKCPSGALSVTMNDGSDIKTEAPATSTAIEVLSGGPLLVHGDLAVKNTDGSTDAKTKVTAFCRCGISSNKPYCDGSHKSSEFDI